MNNLLQAILEDNRTRVADLLAADSHLANCPIDKAKLYESAIFHWIYVGDTALHLAAAGYRVEIAGMLLAAGADPNAAGNHRLSRPLHYAADGCINTAAWDAGRQVETIGCLLAVGADIDARDKNGATPLHRAVRTRCAAAVEYLLKAGADPALKNNSGSTPFHLAVQNTGRGGSGTPEARSAQQRIIEEFLSHGVSSARKDGNGKSVIDCARSEWIQKLLSAKAAKLNTSPGRGRG
jgi:hypothetical protein